MNWDITNSRTNRDKVLWLLARLVGAISWFGWRIQKEVRGAQSWIVNGELDFEPVRLILRAQVEGLGINAT